MSLPKVLFVCVHNSGRSKMAEAFFNRYARGEAVALSAGTEPEDWVNPVVVAAMAEVGFDLSHALPQKLTGDLTMGVFKTITMGCLDGSCPVVPGPREDWPLTDPKGKDLVAVRGIRDEIKSRVLALVKSMGLDPEIG